MSRRGRRRCASPSVALGWPHIVAFTRFGFASRAAWPGSSSRPYFDGSHGSVTPRPPSVCGSRRQAASSACSSTGGICGKRSWRHNRGHPRPRPPGGRTAPPRPGPVRPHGSPETGGRSPSRRSGAGRSALPAGGRRPPSGCTPKRPMPPLRLPRGDAKRCPCNRGVLFLLTADRGGE